VSDDAACRSIPLTRGKVTWVDAADYAALAQFKWHAQPAGNNSGGFYASRSVYLGGPGHETEWMHRVVLRLGRTDALLVDHVNGDGLDNRRANLRIATHGQNMRNVKMRADNRSGFRGVHRRHHRWESVITVSGKHVLLGRFDDASEVARSYDHAAREHFGEFARLNFPGPLEMGA